ncbi:TetR/AcrR family transcriptional regulator [Pseudomonas sp. S2_H01]
MPRVSRQQAKLNRVTIVENAARLFRERGFRNIPLSEVMSSSGLTLGGFYGHFESREALTNEACNHAFEQAVQFWRQLIAGAPNKETARKLIIADYLSQHRVQKSEKTCPVVAFSSEVSQEDHDSRINATYSDGLAKLLGIYMEALDQASSPEELRQQALNEYSVMIGALTLARAARSTDLSEEILKSARTVLGVDDVQLDGQKNSTS